MNCYKFLLLVLAFCSLNLITSCGNDDEEDADTAIVFNCKVDGVAWEADNVSVSIIGESDFGNNISGKSFQLIGASADGRRVNIVVTDFELNNTTECIDEINYYGLFHPNESQNKEVMFDASNSFSSGCSPVYFPVGASAADPYIGGNSNVEITNCNVGKISGKFSFLAESLGFADSISITEGIFTDISFTYQ